MQAIDKIFKKLDRPPAVHNFVRLVDDTAHATAKNIVRFVLGRPPFAYRPSYGAMKARIEDQISLETALRMVEGVGPPLGREHNKSLVEAFFQYDLVRKFSSLNPIDFEKGFYRISRTVLVPVEPLAVVREKGKFTTIFGCGWRDLSSLTLLRRRLIRTICEDAFLSLTDYMDGPAEFLFFPEDKEFVGQKDRTVEVWQRADYDIISSKDLNELANTFLKGRSLARETLVAMSENGAFEQEDLQSTEEASSQSDLFK